MSAPAEAESPTVLKRLWTYQAERFPLGVTALMVAVFVVAAVNVSAVLGGRPLPSLLAYGLAFLVTMIFFFQLRAADEIKDGEVDALYRPERAIPRGLVSLRLVVTLATAAALVAAAACAAFDLRLLWPLLLVWFWMGLMTAEFFVPEWLRARPFAYLVSHMIIMPLFGVFVTACEWLPAAGWPAPGLLVFLALAFMNGCVLEIGRKVWAPVNERPGVETYSSLLGARRAALTWSACVVLACALLIATGAVLGMFAPMAVVGVIAGLATIAIALVFIFRPLPKTQRLLEMAAGAWVLVSYAATALLPAMVR